MPNHHCYLHNNVVAQIVQFDKHCCSGNINLEKHMQSWRHIQRILLSFCPYFKVFIQETQRIINIRRLSTHLQDFLYQK